MTRGLPLSHYLCMAGTIRTLQKCPKCQGKFPAAMICPSCLTQPTRFFIDLWHNGEHLRIYSDPYGFPLDSLARTEQLLATIRHQIGVGTFDSKDFIAKELKNLQFEFYALAWVERLAGDQKQNQISMSYFKNLRRFVNLYFIPHFQRTNIRDIRDGHILDFKRALPEHLSLKSIWNIMGALHKLLAEAKTRKDITAIPEFPKIGKHDADTKWISWEDQQAVLSHCREPYRTLFLFCMKQGCRLGEARALKWDCIKGGIVTIKASMDLGTWKPYTKEGDVRKLPLNSQVKAALMALPRSLTGFVFVNKFGRPLSAARTRAAWVEAAAKAGVVINAYQGTRHSFATQKLLAGYSERMVMEATGHKTVSAFRRYGKMVTEALRGMIEDETGPGLRVTGQE